MRLSLSSYVYARLSTYRSDAFKRLHSAFDHRLLLIGAFVLTERG